MGFILSGRNRYPWNYCERQGFETWLAHDFKESSWLFKLRHTSVFLCQVKVLDTVFILFFWGFKPERHNWNSVWKHVWEHTAWFQCCKWAIQMWLKWSKSVSVKSIECFLKWFIQPMIIWISLAVSYLRCYRKSHYWERVMVHLKNNSAK